MLVFGDVYHLKKIGMALEGDGFLDPCDLACCFCQGGRVTDSFSFR